MAISTEPCGCKHNGSSWVSKCLACSAEDLPVAARWAAEHIRANPAVQYTDEYVNLAAMWDPGIRQHVGATSWLDM